MEEGYQVMKCKPKDRKVAKRAAKTKEPWTESSSDDFIKYAKSDVPLEEVDKNNSPHFLMKRAEFEIRRNESKEAREALENALKYIKKQTHPSSDDFLDFVEHCYEKENHLRASFFQMISAYKKSEEAAEPNDICIFTTKRIKDVRKLVHQIKVTPADIDMKRGKPMKIAQFVTSFLVKMYHVGCEKDESFSESERRKGEALRWIAEAYQDVTEYKKSKKYAKQGKDQIEDNMAKVEYEKLETYVRLLKVLGSSCLREKEYRDALEHFNHALDLIDRADYQSEKRRKRDKVYISQTKSEAERKNSGKK